MFVFKKPQFLTFFLFIVVILLLMALIKEKKQNEPYKREAEIIKNIILKSKKEAINFETERKKLFHPLSLEKERKEKFGENLKDEKIIFVSEEILKTTVILKK